MSKVRKEVYEKGCENSKTTKDNNTAVMSFCRRMKSPKRLTEPTGFGDLRYAEFDKFKP